MNLGYFHRLNRETDNRLWINNPSLEEAGWAIEAGAIGCTTNPTFAAKMLAHPTEGPVARVMLREAVATTSDDTEAGLLVQRRLVERLCDRFEPLHTAPDRGLVSIQVDPFSETDPDKIVAEALADRQLAPNIIAKVPVTAAGLTAIGILAARGIPILATEVMSVSQALVTAEVYERACGRSGIRAPLFLTHITGIFDDHMAAQAASGGLSLPPGLLAQAGTLVARKQYKLLRAGGYRVTMLGGGARNLGHFTEFVGSSMHVTLNWKGGAEALAALNPPLVPRMDVPTSPDDAAALAAVLPDFRRAWEAGGLEVREFEDFGPVERFRNLFVEGWNQLMGCVREARRG